LFQDLESPKFFKVMTMSREQAADPPTLSFEAALAELEKIVAHLERGDVALADSIRIYKRGAALRARCEEQLREAQLEVDQIVMTPDGPRAEPARIGAA
jgi:exodeoxyribonuclease VII small subunit